MSKFYEAIEAIPGVDYVIIREFKGQVEDGGVEGVKTIDGLSLGKIELGANQIPVIPTEVLYEAGLRIIGPEGEVD